VNFNVPPMNGPRSIGIELKIARENITIPTKTASVQRGGTGISVKRQGRKEGQRERVRNYTNDSRDAALVTAFIASRSLSRFTLFTRAYWMKQLQHAPIRADIVYSQRSSCVKLHGRAATVKKLIAFTSRWLIDIDAI